MITTITQGDIDIWPVRGPHSLLDDFHEEKIVLQAKQGFCLVGHDGIHLSIE